METGAMVWWILPAVCGVIGLLLVLGGVGKLIGLRVAAGGARLILGAGALGIGGIIAFAGLNLQTYKRLTLERPVATISFTANANVRWQSRQTTIFEFNPLYDIKPYAVVNAGFGVKAADENWAVNVWGRNLFDEYYWNAVASNANIVVRFPGQVRTYGATATFRF
jgi:outer membrane receptor protein involved in Fe transport